MKRIATSLLATSILLGSFGGAQAVDVKVSGVWDFAFGVTEGLDADGKVQRLKKHTDHLTNTQETWQEPDNFAARQRFRTQINFVASEQLEGVLHFEIGDIVWGRGSDVGNGSTGQGAGGSLGTDGVNIETKSAYLNWAVPNTDLTIRMGLQNLAFPNATFGSAILDDDVAAIVASYKFNDMVTASTFWARLADFGTDLATNKEGNPSRADDVDLFGLLLPITGEGWSLTPWAVYGSVGNGSKFYGVSQTPDNHPDTFYHWENERTNAWWAGAAFELSLFDPLTFGADVNYGKFGSQKINWSSADNHTASLESEGWLLAARLDYKLDWGTPGIFGWWSSGDDAEDAANIKRDATGAITGGTSRSYNYGRMPVLSASSTVTSFGFDGAEGVSPGTAVDYTIVGTWGIGAQIEDVSFVTDLSHILRFAYYEGTNDSGMIRNTFDGRGSTIGLRDGFDDEVLVPLAAPSLYLTDKDNAIEINFDTKYQIYENLAAFVEIGYLHIDWDKHVWNYADNNNGRRNGTEVSTFNDNAWKAQLLFQYTF